jgi:hypothetical protein
LLDKEDENEPIEVINIILKEMNEVLEGKEIRDEWCLGEVVSLYKKGDTANLNNYRGISIIDTIAKVFLKIINIRIVDFLESNNIISRYQCGFRRSEEGISHVASVLEICKRRELKGRETYLCFFDFEKAYDNVNHAILFEKMEAVGINLKIINVIKNLYGKTKMRIRFNNLKSEVYEYKKGVRQGCPCSPTLFNIFVNDILDGMEGVWVPGMNYGVPGLLFADDVVIFGENEEDLKEKIDKMIKWSETNNMKINSSKCGILRWKNNVLGDEDKLCVSTVFGNIEEVDSYVYLGISIKNGSSEEEIVKNSARKGNIALGMLSPKLLNSNISIFLKTMLVRNVLIPVMLYGKELWGMSSVRVGKLRRIVRKAYVYMFRNSNVSTDRMNMELGIWDVTASAAYGRVRARKKWCNSRLVIADLIEGKFVCRRTTWSTRTNRWIKRYLSENVCERSKSEIKKEVEDLFNQRIRKKHSIAMKMAEDFGLQKSTIRRFAKSISITESRVFTKVRCNLINYSHLLVARGLVNSNLRDKCILCEKEVREDLSHILLDCRALDQAREKSEEFIEQIERKFQGNKVWMVNYLLGGRLFESLDNTFENMKKSCKFVNDVVKLRCIKVREKWLIS